MLQLLQNLGTGETLLADVPAPQVGRGTLLIATRRSLVSAGTERMLVDFGRASWIDKARQQPEKVRQVLDKVRTDGLFATLDAVRSKLDQPLALGYCNAGVVLEVGAGVQGFAAGDRVVSNGAHAEVVRVPKNLCARVPDDVSDEAAAFTVLGAIGLQGLRLAAPALGESFVVTGLGLIGLFTVQLLRAQGCRVLGIDLDPAKLALAARFGAEVCDLSRGEDPVARGLAFSGGRGVDGVIVAASTRSNDPIAQAARMSRKRGRIVLVGVTGLELNRSDFYEKELTFQVSCSYGPGRHDPAYEERGNDYPLGFVRWTEQRNFEAVLEMLAQRKVDVGPLVSHRFAIGEAARAYDVLVNDRSALGIVLDYSGAQPETATVRSVALRAAAAASDGKAVLAVVGAGNYGSRVLIPALKAAGADLDTLVSSGGVTALHHGRKSGFARASTDADLDVMRNERINAVVIATRHDSHARLVCAALAAGKHVFVEKPLAIAASEVDEIETAVRAARASGRPRLLTVGFNRRFAPLVVRMKALLAPLAAPLAIVYTVNAGAIPAEHWTQNRETGGGRIVGEACHFIDLVRFLVGRPIVAAKMTSMGRHPALAVAEDKATIVLSFADGSIATVHYLANGGKRFPKERVEVFCNDGVLALENFIRLRGYDWRGFSSQRRWRQDKGQTACAAAFVHAVERGGEAPIPLEEIFEVARVTLALADDQPFSFSPALNRTASHTSGA
ncbi:MAG TPA: bi-domain-containing oxidoreductase [Burkholderiaceae bacterium]|nr:bi-domain-containing oxidoreductase [Burkholderiaceae bacterium]